jgi:Arc/MetJ-type ribon-helix-helix transcriptional regulator
MAKVDTVTLKIPRPLYDRLQQVIEGTGFRSVTEFVLYVLRDLAGDEAHDIETVKKRLEDLGYL